MTLKDLLKVFLLTPHIELFVYVISTEEGHRFIECKRVADNLNGMKALNPYLNDGVKYIATKVNGHMAIYLDKYISSNSK